MSVDVLKPIPFLDQERALKAGYRGHPIDTSHPLFQEPLVTISDYGVEGVNYYSQPNNATGDPIAGVTPHIFVRQSVANKLAAVNDFLADNDAVTELFGGKVELYVRDGFRSPALQGYLYDTVIPKLIRTQNPEWTDKQVQARVAEVVAYPQYSEVSMPPHFTGGAIDVILRLAESGDILDTGHSKAGLGKDSIYTDYLEMVVRRDGLAIEGLQKALQTRRVLFNVMGARTIGGVAMVNNPVETWHYSLYDQMWGILGGHPAAFYGIPPVIPPELDLSEINLN